MRLLTGVLKVVLLDVVPDALGDAGATHRTLPHNRLGSADMFTGRSRALFFLPALLVFFFLLPALSGGGCGCCSGHCDLRCDSWDDRFRYIEGENKPRIKINRRHAQDLAMASRNIHLRGRGHSRRGKYDPPRQGRFKRFFEIAETYARENDLALFLPGVIAPSRSCQRPSTLHPLRAR